MFWISLLFAAVSVAQSTERWSSGNVQPWPIIFDRTASCCSIFDQSSSKRTKYNISNDMKELAYESRSLEDCLSPYIQADYKQSLVKPKGRVAVISAAFEGGEEHSIANISLYRAYQFGIMSAYAEHHGYLFQTHTKINDNIAEADARWVKLRLLIEALDSFNTLSSNIDYLLWIDSDAIVIDFALDVAAIGATYPDAHLIVSSDVRLGRLNSGVMILRNTPFMYQFLKDWFHIADRSTVCDQQAFDLVYNKYISVQPEVTRKRIAILAADALNTYPPVWKSLYRHSHVLHMMGEHSLYRAAVFRYAYQSVCAARSRGSLRPLLGLTNVFLQDVGVDIYKQLTQDMIRASNLTSSTSTTVADLALASHHYVDLLHHLYVSPAETSMHKQIYQHKAQQEILNIRQYIFMTVLHKIEVIKRVYLELEIDSDLRSAALSSFPRKQDQLEELIALMKQGAEAGNDLFWSVRTLEDRQHIHEVTMQLLKELKQLVDLEQSEQVIVHMEALMEQNLGVVLFEEAVDLKVSLAEEVGHRRAWIEGSGVATVLHVSASAHRNTTTYLSYLNGSLMHFASSITHMNRILEKLQVDSTPAFEFLQSLQTFAMALTHDPQLYALLRSNSELMIMHDSKKTTTIFQAKFADLDQIIRVDNAWEVVVDTAKRNAVRYGLSAVEKLGVVLYNAALSSKNIYLFTREPIYLQTAHVLASECETELRHLLEAKQRHHVKSLEASAVQELLNKVAGLQGVLAGLLPAAVPEIPRIQVEVDALGEKKFVFDDVEWEECDIDGEDCVDFLVEETNSTHQTGFSSTTLNSPTSHTHGSFGTMIDSDEFAVDEAFLYIGLSANEARDLHNIRLQYLSSARTRELHRDRHDLSDLLWIGQEIENEVVAGSTLGDGPPAPTTSQNPLSHEEESTCLITKEALEKEVFRLRDENRKLRDAMTILLSDAKEAV